MYCSSHRHAPRACPRCPAGTAIVGAFVLWTFAVAGSALGAAAESRATIAPHKIEIGWCGRPEALSRLAEAKAAGFDYVEPAVRGFASMSDAEFEAALAEHRRVGIATPVGNGFIPDDVRLLGPTAHPAVYNAYVERALSRARRLGMGIVVLGSGVSRSVPEGMSRARAFDELVRAGRGFATIAQRHGIVLAVEPLRRAESNIFNTAAESLNWVKAVDHPHFRLMIDLYHLAVENEPPEVIRSAAGYVVHLHVANPRGRVYPLSADEYDYARFFGQLKAIGYTGRMSIEAAKGDFPAKAPAAIAFLRSAYANAPDPGTP